MTEAQTPTESQREPQRDTEKKPNIIWKIIEWFLGRHEESEYTEYFDDINPQTFRLDCAIWNEYRKDRPGIWYYRQLHTAYERLLELVSDSYLYNPHIIKEQYEAMLQENRVLHKNLAIAEGQLEILQAQLDSALEWQTAKGRKNEVLTMQGMEPETDEPRAQRNGSRFISNSGATKQENMMLASAYHENGWNLEEIAQQLNLAPSSVKAYLSTMKKHYKVEIIQGVRNIVFDGDYGRTTWNLAFYARLEEKFPAGSTVSAVNGQLTAV